MELFNSFNNINRIKIFDLCKNSKSFTELKNILKISTGSLVHHLNILEKEGLITKENAKENNKFKVGKELKITSNIKNLNKKLNFIKERLK